MGDCVEWPGYRKPKGYGWQRIKGRSVFAHRVAYCEANGLKLEDIDGMVVMHTCDNPPCVNPDHLVLGTVRENNADMHQKGRGCKGTAHPHAKLDEARAWYIRARYALGGKTQSELADEFQVSRRVIGRILNGTRWRYT